MNCIKLICCFLTLSVWLIVSTPTLRSQDLDSRQRDGLREAPPAHYAITGGTVHVDSNRVLENATVLIRREKIVAVGSDVAVPDGAVVIDATGKHIYPGWFDGYLAYGETIVPVTTGARYWNERVRPETSVAESFQPSGIKANDMRRAGFTAALVAPTEGILRGSSSVVHISDRGADRAIVKSDVAQHALLTANRRFTFNADPAAATPATRYPSSPMGAYALARQAFYDARWHRDAWQFAASHGAADRPEQNRSLESLYPVLDRKIPLMVQTSNEVFAMRAARFASEFNLKLMILGSGHEYRRLSDVAALGVPLVIPVDFPSPPQVGDATAALDVSLESLMHWDHAPENPKRLHDAGVRFAFTSLGLTRPADFLDRIRKAVQRGLPPEAALAAMTSVPAEIFGVSEQLGTLEAGKFASLLVFDKPVFEKESKLLESWTAGDRLILDAPRARRIDGIWELETAQETPLIFQLVARGDTRLTGTVKTIVEGESEAKESRVQSFTVRDTQVSGSFDSELLGLAGNSVISFVVDEPDRAIGQLVLPDGTLVILRGKRVGDAPEEAPRRGGEGRGRRRGGDRESDDEQAADDAKAAGQDAADQDVAAEKQEPSDADESKQDEDKPEDTGPALFPVNYPLGDFGRMGLPAQPKSVLIHNVTVWTSGPQGTIENGAVLFGDGKIIAIFGAGALMPEADVVIDGRGGHVTPGLIDCHSHMATDSGVNEGSQAVTAEVRIGDFIDPRDMSIYRQLAGGLTCANILHGSANPIGGQNQVIKLRWGGSDEELKFAEAPQGIKFALGENVKQSNRREPSDRYPQTRMGVEQIMHDSFRAAQQYRSAQDRWRRDQRGLPPRIDLELEALAEILEGTRWIHCHSYRQDEILALIRVLDQYGITIGTFQHILEGYKVAPEMAKHGAMASAFSDWWAYKFEVYDAIPYAGAIMHEAGVVVSFNSDDAELARHMNHEAAKAVRFGGVSEVEALKFVTLNPAKQLRIDAFVGSLEPGKHADLVLWNGHPLSTMSRCEQTWIDGRKYFDRADEACVVAEQRAQRAALVQKVLKSGESMERPGENRGDPSLLWPRYDEYCSGHRHGPECWHNQVASTCDACHQCSEEDWACLFGYCRAGRHEYGSCGQTQASNQP